MVEVNVTFISFTPFPRTITFKNVSPKRIKMYLFLNIELQLNQDFFAKQTKMFLWVLSKWINKATSIYYSNCITFFKALSFEKKPLFLELLRSNINNIITNE